MLHCKNKLMSEWDHFFSRESIPKPCSEFLKLFSCSTHLSMFSIMLITVKMPTIVGILTFISMINTTSESLKAIKIFIFQHFSFYEQLKFHDQISLAWKKFYNLRTLHLFSYSDDEGCWSSRGYQWQGMPGCSTCVCCWTQWKTKCYTAKQIGDIHFIYSNEFLHSFGLGQQCIGSSKATRG